MNAIEYQIDEKNNIIFVNEEWDRFAMDNYGEGITSDKIIGKNLFDFIANITVKQIYLDLIAKVRKGNELLIDFRCDATTCKRFLQLTMKIENRNIVKFTSKAKEILSQDYLNILAPTIIRSKELISMCSWCKKIKVETEWEELEHAINKYNLLNQMLPPSLTHTKCEECYEQVNSFIKPF